MQLGLSWNPEKSPPALCNRGGVLLEVKVNQEDMGLLIGRSGSTAKAIRTLARIIGIRNNARVNLRIVEPEGSTHVRANSGERTKSVENVMDELDM